MTKSTLQETPDRKRRKDKRPNEILDAALKVFLERGYSSAKMDDIAALAGVRKGTVYLYFKNKEILFLEVIRRNTIPHIEIANQIVKEYRGPKTALIQMLVTFWWEQVGATTTGEILKIIIGEARNFPSVAQFYLSNVFQPAWNIIASLLQSGIESGEFREVDSELVSRALIKNLLIIVLWRVTFGESDDVALDAEFKMILDYFFAGLRIL
ncbi:TetR/AcrR family transcriptional regulator [Ferribacterium limneticum]|uniref:TetR/AcrR family transcriptional regulator n=1 Tax=Ferribacterium limneticum TaxID=76259 RepID=UPI001CFB9FCC|nr:TetR/AcrR family transcriptional regulator [Ferribacterium limneticum]UCV17729.1 TetR/AcrR family transcriptional regulator [Ferribacterium limneticum]